MGIKYCDAEDIKNVAEEIVRTMNWNYINLESVYFLRSVGSSSRGTIARCHALSKPMQIALGRKGFYLIEVIHERFDKLSNDEKTRVIIHELMHIPKTFGGGFIHHHIVNEKNVELTFMDYIKRKRINNEKRFF